MQIRWHHHRRSRRPEGSRRDTGKRSARWRRSEIRQCCRTRYACLSSPMGGCRPGRASAVWSRGGTYLPGRAVLVGQKCRAHSEWRGCLLDPQIGQCNLGGRCYRMMHVPQLVDGQRAFRRIQRTRRMARARSSAMSHRRSDAGFDAGRARRGHPSDGRACPVVGADPRSPWWRPSAWVGLLRCSMASGVPDSRAAKPRSRT